MGTRTAGGGTPGELEVYRSALSSIKNVHAQALRRYGRHAPRPGEMGGVGPRGPALGPASLACRAVGGPHPPYREGLVCPRPRRSALTEQAADRLIRRRDAARASPECGG